MAIQAGNYTLGPDTATLRVKTGRHGRAAKMGHNLEIEVRSWEATLTVDDDPASSSLALTADGSSLHVVKGKGGMKKLGDEDKADIRLTIDNEILKKQTIEFKSTAVEAAGEGLSVSGDLTIGDTSKPVTFVLEEKKGTLGASTTITQSDWDIEPYAALFGSLIVNDEVEVEVEGTLPDPA